MQRWRLQSQLQRISEEAIAFQAAGKNLGASQPDGGSFSKWHLVYMSLELGILEITYHLKKNHVLEMKRNPSPLADVKNEDIDGAGLGRRRGIMPSAN